MKFKIFFQRFNKQLKMRRYYLKNKKNQQMNLKTNIKKRKIDKYNNLHKTVIIYNRQKIQQ